MKNIIRLSVILIFLETVFKISTSGAVTPQGVLFVCLFSILTATVINLITEFIPGLAKRIITAILVLLLEVPFIVEYFVQRKFGVLYDVNTVIGGSGNVVSGFMGDVIQMILTPLGMLFLVLFLLPAFLVLFVRPRKTKHSGTGTQSSPKKTLLIDIAAIIIFLVLSIGSVTIHEPSRLAYNEEYNFVTATDNFGLLTAVRLDILNNISPRSGGFSGTGGEGGDVEVDIEYGANVLDIDIESIKAGASGERLDLLNYVASLTPTNKNKYTGMFKGKNMIMITAEAFSGTIIDENLTPTLYRMATKGIQFNDFYQPASAGTTGGEYSNLLGMLPSTGGSSMMDTSDNLNYYTLGYQMNELGYFGQMYHNNWRGVYKRHITHESFGYSEGFLALGNGMEDFVKQVWPESDLEMVQGTFEMYKDHQPFNIYYLTVSGHSRYGKGENSMARKNWDQVADMEYSDTVKGYIASQLELENAMTWLLDTLEQEGMLDNTVICISPDHYPYGLDDDSPSGTYKYLAELYGRSIDNAFIRDQNRLIIWSGCLEHDEEGNELEPIVVDSPVCSIDIVPTLFNLFGVDYDSRFLPGRDALSDSDALVFTLGYAWKTDKGTYIDGGFTPKDAETEIPEGYVQEISSIVRNKINFCKMELANDFYRFVFEKNSQFVHMPGEVEEGAIDGTIEGEAAPAGENI